MRENLIIAAMLADRKAYEVVEQFGAGKDFGPIAGMLAEAIGHYYSVDRSVRGCNAEIILSRVARTLQNPKHVAAVEQFLRECPSDVSAISVADEVRAMHRDKIGGKLSLALANGLPSNEVSKLIAEYERAGSSDSLLANAGAGAAGLVDVLDTSDLLSDKTDVDYIRMWPKQLNDRLDGGCLRGHHVLIFARPETGKTLFGINLVVGFLFQKLNVLYVGNEEPAADIRDRIRGRLLKIGRSAVRADRASAAAALAKADIGKVQILPDGGSFAGLRAALEANKPDVIVLDQVRNMRVKSDSRTAELEAAGIEARAIAKEFNALVVSITQAGDSATNKIYLDMSDVDSSKTGIPASADLMIGIGADQNMKDNGMLGISLPKNKLSGLHDKFTVSVNYSTGVIS